MAAGAADRFCSYDTYRDGLLDFAKRMREYHHQRRLPTVSKAIPVYAPASENDVDTYVRKLNGYCTAWEEEFPMAYTDESDKLYVGKEFTPEEFTQWFAAQNLGAKPFNAVGIHHTFRPDASQWTGPQRLKAVFDDYYHNRGWRPWGVGPHLWLYDGTGSYKPSQPLVYVGTHPRHDGYGIVGRNTRWLHIEAIGYYDYQEMSAAMVGLYRDVIQTVCGNRIPIRNCAPGRDNPSQPLGLLFHRDAPGAGKTCPGLTVTSDWFFPAMQKKRDPVVPVRNGKLFVKCGRAEGVPRLAAKPARLMPDSNVRKAPSTAGVVVFNGASDDVRVLGLEDGQAVGGNNVWYLVKVGYKSSGVPDEIGYAHSSVLRTRNVKPFHDSGYASKVPRLCASPARLLHADSVRRGASTHSAVLREGPEEDVRVIGWQLGESVGGSKVWYLSRLGYQTAGTVDEIGFTHSSIVYEREVGQR